MNVTLGTQVPFGQGQIAGIPSQRFDFWLVSAATALTAIGLIMVASTSMSVAGQLEVGSFHFLIRQVIALGLGLCLAFIVMRVPMQWWFNQGWMLLLIAFGLLILVLLPGIGKEVNGSKRWIGLGFMNLQSSEISKICLVLYLASYVVRRQHEVRSSFWGFFKPLLLFCLMATLLLMEPDFGALVVTFCALMGVIFLSGVRLQYFLGIVSVALMCVALIAVSQPYRWQRLVAFQDPFADQFGSGYQLSQALIAFGRGDWFGTGLGNSIQKLSFLPEAHTDFVFAIIAEEFGLLGSLMVIALFAVFLYRIFLVAYRAERLGQHFNAYVAYGLSLLLTSQVLINLGVNTGLLPTKGLTLPFLSYGGTSLMMTCVALGFICRVHWESALLKESADSGGARG